ncbi:monocarboxylate transporter 13 isoform X2 [Protopterus annectens]|nr:monocarboxylate transporter 13 isoform X2 [Protopterus annectens]
MMASPQYSKVPDGGWGWMVVFAAFLQSALVFGVIRSFGVFFVQFVTYFNELSSSVSWITSVGVAVQQFGSPLAGALSNQYGARSVAMLGGFLTSLGMLLAFFATSLMHLYLTIGLLSGLGWALVFTPTIATVTRYFKKRRTLAVGLAFTGVGLSSFAFSPLFQYFVDEYGWRGALLILSGMTANLIVCGSLLRPIALKEDTDTVKAEDSKSKACLQKVSMLLDLTLFYHCPFMRLALAITLINTGYFVPYVHFVAFARETGFDEYQAAFLMSVAAITDLIGRLFSGWMSDLGKLRLVHVLFLWTLLTSVSIAAIPLGTSYPLLVIISTCYGFFSGAMTPVVFSLIPEIVGIQRIFGGLGLLQMIESIGGLLGAPLSGWLRDITGNYTASFLVAGGFLFLGSLVLCTLPNFFSCYSTSASNGQSDDSKRDEAKQLTKQEAESHCNTHIEDIPVKSV